MGLFDKLFKKKGILEKVKFLGKDYEVNPDAMVYSQQGLVQYQGWIGKNKLDFVAKWGVDRRRKQTNHVF
jgi:hypothetical protein